MKLRPTYPRAALRRQSGSYLLEGLIAIRFVLAPELLLEESIEGKAAACTWSPTLKKMIALATINRQYTRAGTKLQCEITVEAVRHRVLATVVKTPFFNPKRKTATPVL